MTQMITLESLHNNNTLTMRSDNHPPTLSRGGLRLLERKTDMPIRMAHGVVHASCRNKAVWKLAELIAMKFRLKLVKVIYK